MDGNYIISTKKFIIHLCFKILTKNLEYLKHLILSGFQFQIVGIWATTIDYYAVRNLSELS